MDSSEPTADTRAAKRRRVSNLTLACFGAVSIAVSLWVIRGFLLMVLMAAFIAVLMQPLRVAARKRFGRHPKLFAIGFTFATLILILMPLTLLGFLLIDQIVHVVNQMNELLGANGLAHLMSGNFPPRIASWVEHVQKVFPISANDLRNGLETASKLIVPTLAGIAAFSARSLFGGFVMLLALFFFFLDGEKFMAWLAEILPLDRRYSRELYEEFHHVSYAMVFGSALTSLITGVISCVGYWIIGVPNPLVWGTLTGLCQVAPAVGNMLIWVPVAVVLLLMGKIKVALLMAGFCIVFLGIGVDNLLRPLIVGRNLELHPLLIFLGILGGVGTFGLPGLVVGPMVLAFSAAALRIYRRDFVMPAQAAELGAVRSGGAPALAPSGVTLAQTTSRDPVDDSELGGGD